MSVDRKEIDLIIRAALQGGKSLESVTKSLKDIEKALDEQTAAAKRGEASFDELKASLESLKRVQRDLGDQAALIGQYQKLAAQIQATSDKVAQATQKYVELDAKVAASGKTTQRQAQQLASYQRIVDAGNKTIALSTAQYTSLGDSLRKAGIDTNNLDGATSRLRQTAADLAAITLRGQESMRTYATDVRKARDAEAALAAQRKNEEAQLASIRAFRQAITDQRIAEIGAAEREAAAQEKARQALRKAADEAIAAARGYKTLGAATKALSGTRTGFRETIQGIIDPAQQARSSLAGIEAELEKVGATVSKINGPIKDYREQLSRLSATQKAVAQQADLIDSYSRQVAVVRQARTEFTQARAQVLQYANALRTSKGENDQLQASLRSAQATLAAAQRNLISQVSSARALQASLRQAGISTTDLAGSQARLTAAAQASTNAVNNLAAAKRRYGESVRSAHEANSLFDSGGRTTLSLLQRMRGEVLSLLAAYVGLYGAINGARAVIDSFNTKQATLNQLSISFGADAGKEYEYLASQADLLGIELEKVQENYAKFAAGATRAGAKTDQVRFIFESFSEAARVMNLSGERQQLIFKALTDIMSKGAIQAEELKNQLGDSLPGIFGIAQEALADKYPNLQKALKDGKVGAEELLTIAQALRETVADQLPFAVNTLAAQQARFNNAMLGFKLAIADSGFIDEMTKLVKTSTEFLTSEDGKKFAADVGGAFAAVAQAARWVIDNLEDIKEWLTIIGVAVLPVMFGRLLRGIVEATAGFRGLIGTMGGFRTVFMTSMGDAIGAMGRADKARFALMSGFLLFESFLAGWSIGKVLSEKFAPVRQFGVALTVGFLKAWTTIEAKSKMIWENIPAFFADGFARLGNEVSNNLRQLVSLFARAARALGADKVADLADTAIANLTFRTNRLQNASKAIQAELERELKRIDEIGLELFIEAGQAKQKAATPQKPTAQPTPFPEDTKFGDKNADVEADEKAATKRLQIKQTLEAALTALEAKIERNEKDSLARRLNSIALAYKDLMGKIIAFGGAEGAAMAQRLNQLVEELRTQEIRKFNDTIQKEQETLLNKIEDAEARFASKQKTDLASRLVAVEKQYADHYRKIAELREMLTENAFTPGFQGDPFAAEDLQARLDGVVALTQQLEQVKFYEDSVNVVLEERKAKIDTINAKLAAGLIGENESRQQIKVVLDETQLKLVEIADAGILFLQTLIATKQAAGENVTELERVLASLINARAEVGKYKTDVISAAQVNQMLTNGLTQAFEQSAMAIGSAIVGMQSWGDAIEATRNAFLKFAADFLMELGKMILKQALLNSLQNSGNSTGGFGGIIATAISAMFHRGGIVGSSGGQRRPVMASWFANAPRYHGGGIPGLAPNEYPAILKKNEEVLTESDPRNVLNGGAATGGANVDLKIMNMIDSASVISEGVSSPAGQRAIFNFMTANRTEMKTILGVK